MSKVTSKDGTTIAYDKTGQGAPVILVNGAMAYRQIQGEQPLAEALTSAFTVYIYDRRGRGKSGDTQPYAVDREIEDIEALIDHAGGSAYLYGASSGAVLALRAAAKLGADKVKKLALYEPPYSVGDEAVKEFADYAAKTDELLKAGKHDDAVAFFLADMLPPDVLADLRASSDWALMEAVAPTLAYDNLLLGDSAVPVDLARAVTMPTLVLDGESTLEFFADVTDALVKALPNAQHQTLPDQTHSADPAIIAPALTTFFNS